MKKSFLIHFLGFGALSFLVALNVGAKDLTSELDSLNVNEQLPTSNVTEKLYSIQTRAVELSHRFEFLLGGSQDFTSDSFVTNRQVSFEAQYHLTDHWSFAATYSNDSNQFTSSAQNLINTQGVVPDVDYTIERTEARVQYNLFYGKIRFTRDTATYFDQYVALGYALNLQGSGMSPGPVLDVGFAHWISNWGSVHWGLKDYYLTERRVQSTDERHNIYAYLEVGYLL